ncbi:MAG: exodeoxyribonuclease VII large subunit [Bdellovibrionales bacterium]|nr:exodeoxyribonuclease VII large subunit [Bdellovibrionales bacterium]
MDFEAAKVSELVSSIKNLLEEEFQEVYVQGEVTNLSPSASGHWYFTLSDESACISVALFKGDALRNPLIRTLKDGDQIIVLGPVSVYQKRGSFQILAKRILPVGAGQLKLQFEKLKAKLSLEGLFDLDQKKAIPKFPQRIAVITAEHGAALQDFLNVYKGRSLWCDIVIIPALVQGAGAAKTLIAGIKKAEGLAGVETIVLTRGGGSLEDLWAFNDEELVRTIFKCQIPVISAVGHEVDFSLCDYVADHRSETPTAAAVTLSQPQTELKARLHFCQTHLKSDLFKLRQRIELLTHKFHPREMINIVVQKVQRAQKALAQIRLHERAEELIGLVESTQRVDELQVRLTHAMNIQMNATSEKLKRFEHVLSALNPKLVLKRGYSFVKVQGKEVVPSLEQFNKITPGSKLSLQFHDGLGIVTKDVE